QPGQGGVVGQHELRVARGTRQAGARIAGSAEVEPRAAIAVDDTLDVLEASDGDHDTSVSHEVGAAASLAGAGEDGGPMRITILPSRSTFTPEKGTPALAAARMARVRSRSLKV